VGTNGVSYLGIAQWKMASLSPPHLKAIVPWEGFTDFYRDGAYHGGIPNSFVHGWFKYRILRNLHSDETEYTNLPKLIGNNPLATANIYQKISAENYLKNITVPAYVAVSIQDHGLHTRGTINGYQSISSKDKWLELHGRKKWEYYSDEAVGRQRQFFDQFLKEENSGILDQPKVRYELRESHYKGVVKTSNTWPIPNREFQKLFLNAANSTLTTKKSDDEETKSYNASLLVEDANGKLPEIKDRQRLKFSYRFTKTTDVVGSIKLKLFVSSDSANDIDLFVGIEKQDHQGNEISLEGSGGELGQVAYGWQRISHRKLDLEKSSDEIPFHSHDEIKYINPNEVVTVEVEIWPSTTRFNKGEQLVLTIQGNDIKKSDVFHIGNVNKGNTTIYTGGKYESYVQIPIL